MSARFKPLEGQVIVVTGAGSGLGLQIARLAAKAGAAVVLTAGDEATVRAACAEIGGRCHPVAADPASADGCDRVARAAVARFGRIDSWIDAAGVEAALAPAVQALVKHLGEGEAAAAVVAFGQRIDKAARAELRQAKGRIAATLIKLPKDWRHDSPAQKAFGAAAEAALHAVAKPMGEMALAARGKGLTAVTQARKHPSVLVGVGLLAVAGAALWFGRGRIAGAAAAARPRVARAVRPALMGMVKRRPLQAAQLVAKHPKPALRLARILR
ncbi:SDR family NAD(P)-dependent oxidoreductase [Phenylobacterium sp.]|uniref:SDR family NAD(P)-dependent oxidoreductase n=1 Tax=Phenylobacterium sp. TaxID=1871053 RepID=UPI002D0580C6|nr:SDR family NAD(P)-dependent oxidoreductase [Phenylobacterium sp.]HLZ75658.1 SDR family NAD(P)-dependent oxidoreductase [Phenylobacterium sp.]